MNNPLSVVIADDEPTMLGLMKSILDDQVGYTVELASDGRDALDRIVAHSPDLLITDLKMPHMSGEALAAEALRLRPDLTVIVLTGNGTIEGAVKLMKEGVYDYLTKPFVVEDFVSSIHRAAQRARSLSICQDAAGIVLSLTKALETKDPYLKNHSFRVATLCRKVSLDLGLSIERAVAVERAGLVHDLGKIGIPETILQKLGPLTPGEYDLMKKHPAYSAEIIRPLREFTDCLPFVYHHHERIDGRGYPDGIAGDAIPLGARIIAACDTYDAMASDRSYRAKMPESKVHQNLLEARGTQLDAEVVDTLLGRLKKP